MKYTEIFDLEFPIYRLSADGHYYMIEKLGSQTWLSHSVATVKNYYAEYCNKYLSLYDLKSLIEKSALGTKSAYVLEYVKAVEIMGKNCPK